jgi:hypothetical protein
MGSVNERKGRAPSGLIERIAWVIFGCYILVTSLVGILLGVQAFNGWLAILYGALGASMGLAAIVCGFVTGPKRAMFLGWCLVGLATRAVLEGDLYLWFVSLPIAAILLTALALNLQRLPLWSDRMATLGAGIGSILALALLAAVAPSLPAICPSRQPAGKSVSLISYPPGVFPWDATEEKYIAACM